MPCGETEKGDGIAGWGECFHFPRRIIQGNVSNLDRRREGVETEADIKGQ